MQNILYSLDTLVAYPIFEHLGLDIHRYLVKSMDAFPVLAMSAMSQY